MHDIDALIHACAGWAVLLIVLVCTLGLAAIGLGAPIIAQKLWSRKGPGFSRYVPVLCSTPDALTRPS